MTRRSFDIVLAAGGTGGHVIPAQALAAELKARGHRPLFFTDDRGLRYAHLFPEIPMFDVASAPSGRGFVTRVHAILRILAGTVRARRLLKEVAPAAMVGFGGYPSLPSGLAAALSGVPLCLHEQNAVFGRSNRVLARMARAVALSFAGTRRLATRADRVKVTGNPVRPAIAALYDQGYEAPEEDGPCHLLVIGGSQGATVLSDIVPAAVSALPRALQERLRVVQQARAEDLDRVRAAYATLGVAAEILTFIDDVPSVLADCHLVIARAGASTVSELAVAGRPAVLVPFPAATDDHQTANAAELERAGGAWVIGEREFTPGALAKLLQIALRDPAKLEAAAAAARSVGRPDAAADLADIIERMIVAHGPLTALSLREEHTPGPDGLAFTQVNLRSAA